MLSENIEDVTKAARLTSELFEVIRTLPIENWLIIAVFLIWIILNKGYIIRLLELAEQQKKRKLELMNSYISLPKQEIDQKTLDALVEMRNAFHFSQQTKYTKGSRCGMHL